MRKYAKAVHEFETLKTPGVVMLWESPQLPIALSGTAFGCD
jgi:hypothetical protein